MGAALTRRSMNYRIVGGLSVLAIVVLTGSLNISRSFIRRPMAGGYSETLCRAHCAVIFIIAVTAETNQAPFDLAGESDDGRFSPEAEDEIRPGTLASMLVYLLCCHRRHILPLTDGYPCTSATGGFNRDGLYPTSTFGSSEKHSSSSS